MAKIQFRVKGRPPGMLQHNPVGSMKEKTAGPKKIPSPEVEAERATYRDENGYLLFPMAAVKKSMLTGAVGHKFGRTAVTTMLRNNILDVYSPDGDLLWLHLTDEDENPLTEYEINIQRAVVGKASVLRARPLIENWYTSLVIEYDDQAISSPEIIQNYLERAGMVVGWGDYRPQTGGIYGRFDVIKAQVIG